jgi:hypothetical protein
MKNKFEVIKPLSMSMTNKKRDPFWTLLRMYTQNMMMMLEVMYADQDIKAMRLWSDDIIIK